MVHVGGIEQGRCQSGEQYNYQPASC
jgi:hypothetical protein